MERRAPLRKRSAKRAAADRELAALRARVLAARVPCEAVGFLDVQCSGRRVVHHVVRRSQGGQHVDANVLVVCNTHHVLIHDNPGHAMDVGLLRSAP
jgi:hypothetical protein